MDGLAILGKAVDHEDQIDLILEGLPEDYKNVIDQIEGRDVPPLITELHERLLNHEAKLLSLRNALVSPTLVTANMAQQRNNLDAVRSVAHKETVPSNALNSKAISLLVSRKLVHSCLEILELISPYLLPTTLPTG